MRIALCDNQTSFLHIFTKKLRDEFHQYSKLYEISSFADGNSLLAEHRNNPFEVIFLDIEMPFMSGLEVADALREHSDDTIIVFVSGKDSYVYKSLKFSPFRFIRKSKIFNEIQEVIRELHNELLNKQRGIYFTNNDKSIFIKIHLIHYILAKGNKTFVSYKGDDLLLDISFKTFISKASFISFIEIGKSCLVNYKYITSIVDDKLTLEDGAELSIKKRDIERVKDFLLKVGG